MPIETMPEDALLEIDSRILLIANQRALRTTCRTLHATLGRLRGTSATALDMIAVGLTTEQCVAKFLDAQGDEQQPGVCWFRNIPRAWRLARFEIVHTLGALSEISRHMPGLKLDTPHALLPDTLRHNQEAKRLLHIAHNLVKCGDSDGGGARVPDSVFANCSEFLDRVHPVRIMGLPIGARVVDFLVFRAAEALRCLRVSLACWIRRLVRGTTHHAYSVDERCELVRMVFHLIPIEELHIAKPYSVAFGHPSTGVLKSIPGVLGQACRYAFVGNAAMVKTVIALESTDAPVIRRARVALDELLSGNGNAYGLPGSPLNDAVLNEIVDDEACSPAYSADWNRDAVRRILGNAGVCVSADAYRNTQACKEVLDAYLSTLAP